MILYSLYVVGYITSCVLAAPSSRYVVHEKRDNIASHWTEREFEVDGRSVIPLSIGLAQQNLENGYDFLMDVSAPDSLNYGKHWSAEKVASICFQPS
jgi:tripeptidyl-peptidase-1